MTRSTEDPTTREPRSGRKGLDKGLLVGVISVVVALIALYPAYGSYLLDRDGAKETPPPPGPTTGGPPATGGQATGGQATGGQATGAPPAGWRSLWELPQIAGTLTDQRPDGLRDAPGLDGARFLTCDGQRAALRWQLTRQWAQVRLTAAAWSAQRSPAQITVQAFTATKGTDGQTTTARADWVAPRTGGEADTLGARIPGADDLVLQVDCERKGDTLALTAAEVLPAA